MVNLKFGAFIFALCFLLKSCVCDTTNPCTIQDTTATCVSNENFKSVQDATNITKLIVRSKELKRIDKDDLAVFVNLEEIDLSNSGLEEIDANAFVGLAKLHKINLAGNTKLKIPNDGSFISSNTVTCLNLSSTLVEQLDKTFAHLPQLENLDLSNTNVKDFSPLKLQEHLTKLVVSKTEENKDLCNILAIKEIIERDANGTEIQLDCKPKDVGITKDNKEENNKKDKEENSKKVQEQSTTPKIEEPPTTAAKIEVSTEASTVATKTEETKSSETTTKETVKEVKGLETPVQNLTNKAEDEPKSITENSDKEKEHNSSAEEKEHKNSAEAKEHKTSTEEKEHQSPAEEKEQKSSDKGKEHSNTDKETPVVIVLKDDKTKYSTESATEKATTEEIEKPEEKTNVTTANETTEQPTINSGDETDKKPERKAKILDNEAKNKQSADDKPRVLLDSAEDVILPSTANTSQSNGVNIVLGIILCVMIVGAIGFGYKYWKNRRSGYTHANTQDDEDKELQTIVAYRTETDQN